MIGGKERLALVVWVHMLAKALLTQLQTVKNLNFHRSHLHLSAACTVQEAIVQRAELPEIYNAD